MLARAARFFPASGSKGAALGGHSPFSRQPCTKALVMSARLIGTEGVRDDTTILLKMSEYAFGVMDLRMALSGRSGSARGTSGSADMASVSGDEDCESVPMGVDASDD